MIISSLLLAGAVCLGDPREPLGHAAAPNLREISGVVASRRFPGIFWTHGDSGNAPAIFALRRDGSLVREFKINGLNVDWEDISIDDAGHLYIGETGNNFGRLPLRAVYRVDEPDPEKPAAKPLPINLTLFYGFESAEKRFDSESLFVDGGDVVIIAKRFDGKEPNLFALSIAEPGSLLKPATPRVLGKLAGFVEPATGADLAPDGKRLVVCSESVARVYVRDKRGANWSLQAEVRYPAGAQVESVCWDARDLLLIGESGDIFRIAERVWIKSTPAPQTRH